MSIPHAPFEEFHLIRNEDIHGNSGTGVIARGMIYPSGFVYMEWVSHVHTETRFNNIKDVELLHSHNGRTVVVMGPPPPFEDEEKEKPKKKRKAKKKDK